MAARVAAGLITLGRAFNLAALAALIEGPGGLCEYLRVPFGNLAAFVLG